MQSSSNHTTDGYGFGSRFVHRLNQVEKWFAFFGAACVGLIMLAVTTQVVARYVFKESFPGVFESTELLIVAVVYMGLAYIESENGHIKMDLLLDNIHGRSRKVLDIVILALSLALFVLITYKTGQYAINSFIAGDVSMGIIKWPLWPSKFFVPIGTALLSLRLLVHLIIRIITPAHDATINTEVDEVKRWT